MYNNIFSIVLSNIIILLLKSPPHFLKHHPRDLVMEVTWRDRESARKIFKTDARCGPRNARLHSEGRVQEEEAESESRKERGKD
jgi:hypothetical protein